MIDDDEPKKPEDMTADEAAWFGMQLLNDKVYEKSSDKFLYFALKQDPKCPSGMYYMTEFLNQFLVPDAIASLCAYALNCELPDNYKEKFQKLLREIDSNQVEPDPRPNPRVMVSLVEVNPESLFSACVLFVGHLGEASRHQSAGAEIFWDRFDEYFHPERFVETDQYKKFLVSTILDPDIVFPTAPPYKPPVEFPEVTDDVFDANKAANG